MNGHAIKGVSAALVRGLFGCSGQPFSSGVRTAVGTGAGQCRRIRVRTTLLHAPVLAILGALLPLAATAQQPPVPAPEVTMVTNFGQQVVHGRVRTLDEDAPVLAQAFTTGVDRGSFEATSIGFKVAKVNEVDGFDVTVSLYEARGTGRPRTKIADLVRSNSIREYRRNYWEMPDGIILEPDTSYVVVVRCDLGATAAEMCNGDETIRFRAVEDNDEDDVEYGVDEGLFDGWSIANNGFGGVWGGLSVDNASHAMEVEGYSARIPYIIDNGVTMTSTPRDGGDTYSYGETIEISVRLSRAILVEFDPIVIENAVGLEITQDRPLYPDIAPSLRFSLGDSGAAQDRYAHYAGGNYTNTLKFHYIVTSADMDTDGIEIPAGDDAFGHNLPRAFQGDTTRVIANLEFPALGIQTDHKVDSTPKIDTVNLSEPIRITSVPAIGTTYRNREVVEVTVTFDQPVLVTPPVKASIGIDGGSGGKWRGAAYSHGSGTESVAFRYVVTEEDIDTDGIEIFSNLLAQGGDPHHADGVQGAGDITSIRGSLAIDLASAGVPDDPNHKVDGSMTNPHVEVSPVQLVVDEGDSAGASYMVWLTEEPSGSVTVTVDGFSGTDVSVDSASLTFTTADWSTRQTVTVTADQDDDAEDDEVTLTHTVAGGGYGSATAADVTVTVRDNDTQGVTTSMMALTVPEGGTATYTVVLNAEPASDVTVIVTGASGDVSIDGAIDGDRVLTFTSVNWNVPQTVTVRAAEDGDAVADDPVTLMNALAGGGNVAVTVMVTENDTTSVSVAPTALRVNEGTSDTYTVVLTALPTGNVTVTVSGASGDVMVDRTSLTFTPVTWETAQTVTVTAAQDVDGVNDSVTLTHAVAGGGYDGVVVSDVEVTVEDDERGVTVSETALTVAEGDAAGSSYTVVLATQPTGDVTVTVGGHSGTDVSVSSASLTFSTTTWNMAQTVTVTAGQDPDALNDTVTLTHAVTGGGYDGVDVASVEVAVEDDERGVVVSETELTVTEGDAAGSSYTVVLAAQPTGDVTVTVEGHSGTDVSVSSVSLTFSTTTWETAQTVTVTAAQDADGVNDSVTLTHAVAGGGYDGVDEASVVVTVEDDERGVVVSETELTVTEGDATGSSYTVVLATQPTGDVTVTVGGHSGTDVLVSSASLTFSTTTWQTEQTVTVTAAQDADGVNDTVTLTHSVTGGGYDDVDVASVEVTVEDDERGVVVSETELTVTEGDATGSSYTVVLAAEPTGDVTVTVDGHAGTDVSVSSASLTFSTTTWNTAQTVTVTAGQDTDALNDTVTLTHAVTGGGYDGVDVASVEVTVEDDERGVTVSETALTVAEGDAAGSSYTVVLATQPTGDVTVTVGGPSGTDVSVSSEILTFTPAMWQTAQTVTVTAGQDPDALNDTVTLTHSVTGGGYDDVDVASVEVTVEDDERGVVVSGTVLTVTEGDATGSSYTLVLSAQPVGDVTVTVGGHSGTDVSVSSASLTFSTTTWQTQQTVTVTAAHDIDALNDTVTLTHAVSGGGYDGVVVASVEVVVEDDERGVVVSETELTVTEGDATGSSYTVVLSTEPTGDVTVTVGGHSGTDVLVSSASLTFAAVTWNTAQTVTVTAGHDADALNDTVTLTHAVSGGGYDGVDVASVEVTVEDDDRRVVVSEPDLTVTEGDAAGSSYTLVLSAQPTGDVTVTVDGHSGTDVSVSSASLTFAAVTWNTEQTVTVTARDDADASNDTVTLTHAVTGGGYDGVVVSNVDVTVEDDDSQGVIVAPTTLEVREGGTGTYTVVLAAEPAGDVVVTVGGYSGTEVSVSRDILTFTPATWYTEQTVTVTAGQDADALNDAVMLSHSISLVRGLGGVVASVEVTVMDDDAARVTVAPTTLVVREGSTGRYTVVLTAEPTGDVTVTVGGYSGTDVTVDNTSLTFSTITWETEQTVTVTAGQDAGDVNDTVALTHSVSGGGYDGVDVASVEVKVSDDERVTGDVEPSGSIRLCGARFDPRPDGLSESEIDICWDVESAIPGDVVIEMRSRDHWDALHEPYVRFTKWQRVERGNSFTPCDVAAETCVKATQGFLYRGEPRTYELRIRRGTTLLAKSPRLKAQAPNRSTNVFEPRLARDVDTGSDGAVGQPSGPYNLKLAFSEEYPEDYFLNIWRTETVPCLGSEAQCLEPQDFDVTNATLTIKAWREGCYRIVVTPTTLGQPVSVSLPANKVKGVGEGVEADGTNQYTRYNVASNEVVTPTSTPRIGAASGSSLTAQFDAKPASHDGMTPFTVRIAFSEAVSTTAAALRDHVVEVTGGTVTAADRVDGRSDLWEFTIEPASSADVTVVVPAGRDCAGSGAVCTTDGRPLLNGLAAVIAGPGAGTRAVPLTAQFDSMPVEHDGAAAFTFELRFSEAISTPVKALRDHAITVSGARVEKAKRVDGRSDRWRITVAPDSHADVTVILAAGRPCTETGAVCTAAGEPLSNALAAVVRGPAALSVADARAREGVDAAIVFDVTLDRAAFAPVTVGYATGDGSARAGEDFTETSGTLTFAVGETVESVVVPLLDDAKDEGEETFTLTLANVSGARIADSQAVGTIVNDDSLQTQWIAHFGRTVASQAVEAIEERLDGRGDTHVTVGGIRLTGRKPTADDAQTRVDPWPDKLEPVWETRTMTGRELLLGQRVPTEDRRRGRRTALDRLGAVRAGRIPCERRRGALERRSHYGAARCGRLARALARRCRIGCERGRGPVQSHERDGVALFERHGRERSHERLSLCAVPSHRAPRCLGDGRSRARRDDN